MSDSPVYWKQLLFGSSDILNNRLCKKLLGNCNCSDSHRLTMPSMMPIFWFTFSCFTVMGRWFDLYNLVDVGMSLTNWMGGIPNLSKFSLLLKDMHILLNTLFCKTVLFERCWFYFFLCSSTHHTRVVDHQFWQWKTTSQETHKMLGNKKIN